ncbi:MAG: hypothetical protein AABY16_01960 [Nanoarchaeota archaeon]
MIVKILGLIDVCAALILLAGAFGVPVIFQIYVFFGGLLFMKSLFLITGDVLSAVDLVSSIIIFLSIFFTPWSFLIWTLSLLLMSKGAASFF